VCRGTNWRYSDMRRCKNKKGKERRKSKRNIMKGKEKKEGKREKGRKKTRKQGTNTGY
jgi:hypothetical protein